MGKKNKNRQMKQVAPFLPTRLPQDPTVLRAMQMTKNIEKIVDAESLQRSNQTMNLTVSALILVLREKYSFSEDQLFDVVENMFNQLEQCGKQLATIDHMMLLSEEYGVKCQLDNERMDSIGTEMQNRIKIFELLDKGITELEDLARITQISSRDCSGYRWLYNRIKYNTEEIQMTKADEVIELCKQGKNKQEIIEITGVTSTTADTYINVYKNMYTEDEKMTEKMKKCFDLFKENKTVPEVIKETGLGKVFVLNASSEYKRIEELKAKKANEKKALSDMNTDEFADKLFNESSQPEKKTYVAPSQKKAAIINEDFEKAFQNAEDEPIKEDPSTPTIEVNEEIIDQKGIKPALKKKVTIEYESSMPEDFQYSIKNGELYLNLSALSGTNDGANILSKEQANVLLNELAEIIQDM